MAFRKIDYGVGLSMHNVYGHRIFMDEAFDQGVNPKLMEQICIASKCKVYQSLIKLERDLFAEGMTVKCTCTEGNGTHLPETCDVHARTIEEVMAPFQKSSTGLRSTLPDPKVQDFLPFPKTNRWNKTEEPQNA